MSTDAGADAVAAGTGGRQRRGRAIGRLRRATVAAAGLLLVIGASVVGLHDVADSHLASPETSLHA